MSQTARPQFSASVPRRASVRQALRQGGAALCCAVASALLGGCAAFQNYNSVMAPVRTAFAAGDFATARAELAKRMRGPDGENDTRLNPWLELGVIEHTAGDFAASQRALDRAIRIVRDEENKAVVSATQTAAAAATMIVNEGAQPYYGEPFEKILIHTFQALNYMARDDWEGARVEIRLAYARQEQSARDHEQQLAKAREDAAGQQVNDASLAASLDQAYADQDAVASRVANAYQNAFTHAVSAIVFNAQREANNAYIELKRANELRPGAACLGPLTIETAEAAGFREDLPRWERAFGLDARDVIEEARRNPAELVVVFENGWAPLKHQITIPIPTPMGIFTLAIPKYDLQPGAANALAVSCGGRSARSDLLGDLEAQAVRSLRDRMKVYAIKMAARIAARLAAEYVLQQQMRKEYGDLGAVGAFLISSAINIALERADLRAWTLLPRDAQLTRLRLPEGEADVTLRLEGGDGGGASRVIPLRLRRDRPNIVIVRSLGSLMAVHTNAGRE